jgi:hypothetical protein
MSIDFSSTGNLSIAGTNYMTIDTAGRVLKPFQVAFSTNNNNATVAGADIIFLTAIFNIGSAYNVANGRFTAPVAGRYFLRFHQLAPNANAGEYRTALYVNGAGYGGSRFITNKPASTWWSLIAEGHIFLNANDYATVRYETGAGSMYTDLNYGQFSGHLIG